MEPIEGQKAEKSQGSHGGADLAAPSTPDGRQMEPSRVPCNNPKCARHGEMILPEVDGLARRCPACKAVVKGSKLAQRYSLDERDVSYRAEQHVRDFHADTTYLRGLCEELAECDLSIKKVRKGSAEHQRLFAIRNDLHEKLKAHRNALRAEAAGTTSSGSRVVIFRLPDNGRDSDTAAHSPDDSALSRENTASAESSAAAVVEAPKPVPLRVEPRRDEYLVPERTFSSNTSHVRMRPVTEKEVEQCMDLQGDLQNYRDGKVSRFAAYRQTQAWLKSKGGFQ